MRYKVTIGGMGCEHCTSSVKDALSEIGASAIKVEIGSAEFDFDASEENISSAIEDIGFEVKSIVVG